MGGVDHVLAGREHSVGLAAMHDGVGEQAEAAVVVLVVLPMHEAAAEVEGMVEAREEIGEVGLIPRVVNWLSEAFGERCVAGCATGVMPRVASS